MARQSVTPFLWFDKEAEDAANFYVSVFKNSRILSLARYSEVGPGPAGSVMVVEFELDGQRFTALNAGPMFKFNEAVSFVIDTADQAETDYYWEALTVDGGAPSHCGWLKDKYGLSWQVVPRRTVELMTDPDAKKAQAATAAMLKMRKLDIAEMERAAAAA